MLGCGRQPGPSPCFQAQFTPFLCTNPLSIFLSIARFATASQLAVAVSNPAGGTPGTCSPGSPALRCSPIKLGESPRSSCKRVHADSLAACFSKLPKPWRSPGPPVRFIRFTMPASALAESQAAAKSTFLAYAAARKGGRTPPALRVVELAARLYCSTLSALQRWGCTSGRFWKPLTVRALGWRAARPRSAAHRSRRSRGASSARRLSSSTHIASSTHFPSGAGQDHAPLPRGVRDVL